MDIQLQSTHCYFPALLRVTTSPPQFLLEFLVTEVIRDAT